MNSIEKLDQIIDEIVLRRLIENIFDRNTIPEDAREKLIKPAFRRLGFSYEEPPDFELAAMTNDFKEYFELELSSSSFHPRASDWRGRSLSTAQLSPGADRTLVAWAYAEPDEFVLIAGPKQYANPEGHIESPPTRLRDGQTIHTGHSYFYCCYRGGKMLVSLQDIEVQIDGTPKWFWLTAVEWAERPCDASSFIETLSGRVDGYLVTERKGHILSSTYQPVLLQTYQLDELAYPTQTRQDVEELVTAFDRWQSPACTVSHWGAALIGKPGTGKTTIAGILAGRKQSHCTVLYCPAHDFLNLPRGASIQIIVRDVFDWARQLAPTLLIVDDLDMIVPARGHDYLDPVTSCFMENLDSLSSTTKLFLLVTTNRPDIVESAILDRPGRVGTRIHFEGFDACFWELLQSQARLHGLQWNNTLADIVTSDDYQALMSSIEVTPDIAKNIIRRVALSENGTLTSHTLANALRATTRSFGTSTTST